MNAAITINDFKSYFSRDFVYDVTPPSVTDNDISKAIAESSYTFNYGLYPSAEVSEVQKTALLYLTAHILLLNTYSADTGGQSQFMQNSRSVGGISESLEIPEYMKQGENNWYSSTYYGQRFLLISKPYMDGVVLTVSGQTQF